MQGQCTWKRITTSEKIPPSITSVVPKYHNCGDHIVCISAVTTSHSKWKLTQPPTVHKGDCCAFNPDSSVPCDTSLQFALDIITICVHLQMVQNAAALVTKCVGWIYCKMLQTYYTMCTLLKNAAIVIAKCVAYYKMRRYYTMPKNSVAV